MDKTIELAKTAAEKHWQEKEKSLSAAVEEMEGQLSLAEKLFRDEQILDAILNKNIEFYPKSSTAHNSLAYTYFSHGRKQPALECLKKVLDWIPTTGTLKK